MNFSDFGLSQPILTAVSEEGYDTPTPIQVKAIPHVLAGRDLLGCAQTGTGKTAAFALPILEQLAATHSPREKRPLRVLVLSPTRELATQIGDSFGAYGRHTHLKHAVIFGGVNQSRQVDMLRSHPDILVATPGRLLDLMNQGFVSLSDLTIFVLDEADRMLDMGFVHDVRRIAAKVPKQRQTLLFSATMPDSIRALANSLLSEPVEVAVTPVASTAETVDQCIYFVEKGDKRALLSWVLDNERIDRAIVFTRTKHGANRVAEYLEKRGVQAAAIHGNKSQNARERALAGFKDGRLRALIATDIAARGIDIDELAFVINFDLPNVPESYVHRIGRTGRAGASGRALSFCDQEERAYLVDIERLIKQHIPAVVDHPYPSTFGVPKATNLTPQRPSGAKGRGDAVAGRSAQAQPGRSGEGRREGPRREGGGRKDRGGQRGLTSARAQGPQDGERRDQPQSERRDARGHETPRSEPRHDGRARSQADRGDPQRRDDRTGHDRTERPHGERRDASDHGQSRQERRDGAERGQVRQGQTQARHDQGHAHPRPDSAHRGERERRDRHRDHSEAQR